MPFFGNQQSYLLREIHATDQHYPPRYPKPKTRVREEWGGFAKLLPVVFFVKEVLASSCSGRFPAFLRTAWCILRLWRMPPFPSRSPCDNIESPAPNAESCLSLSQSTRMYTTNSTAFSYIHLFYILYFSHHILVYSSNHLTQF